MPVPFAGYFCFVISTCSLGQSSLPAEDAMFIAGPTFAFTLGNIVIACICDFDIVREFLHCLFKETKLYQFVLQQLNWCCALSKEHTSEEQHPCSFSTCSLQFFGAAMKRKKKKPVLAISIHLRRNKKDLQEQQFRNQWLQLWESFSLSWGLHLPVLVPLHSLLVEAALAQIEASASGSQWPCAIFFLWQHPGY